MGAMICNFEAREDIINYLIEKDEDHFDSLSDFVGFDPAYDYIKANPEKFKATRQRRRADKY